MKFDPALQKNILWTVGLRYGSHVLSVLSILILARNLGSAGFGEYAFISAIVMIGNALSTFGTDMVLIRRISACNDYSDFLNALGVQLLISLVFILILSFSYFIFPSQKSLLIYSFALIPLSFFTMFTIVLRGARELQLFSLLHLASGILQFGSILVLVINKWGVQQLVFLLLGAHVISGLFGFIFCKNQIKLIFPSRNFSMAGMPLLMRESSGMALIGTLRLVYEKISISIFPLISNVANTGLFSAALRVVDAAKLGHISALTAIYPAMARDDEFTKNQSGFRFLLLISGLISLILSLFSKQIILLLFGVQYINSVEALRILAWILVPYFVVSYFSLAFIARSVEKPVLRALVLSLLLLLTLLVKLNSIYGLRGAAVSLLAAEVFHAALLLIQWRYYAFPESSK